MATPFNLAAAAYGNAAKLMQQAKSGAEPAAQAGGFDFGNSGKTFPCPEKRYFRL